MKHCVPLPYFIFRSISLFCKYNIQHIYREIGLTSKKKRNLLENFQINSLHDLASFKTRMENGDFESLQNKEGIKESLRMSVEETLLKASEWIRRNPEVDVIKEFDEDVWDDFCDGYDTKEVLSDGKEEEGNLDPKNLSLNHNSVSMMPADMMVRAGPLCIA